MMVAVDSLGSLDEVEPADAAAAGEATTTLDPGVLFEDHFASLCRTAYLVVGDTALAEELVMEVFASVLPRWTLVEQADHPLAYLRRSVVNLAVSRLRRLRLERRTAARRAAAPPATRTDASDDDAAVLAALRQLPARQRACVVLRYFNDMTDPDIAAALGCTVGTVKSQLSKARARLAELLDVSDEERR